MGAKKKSTATDDAAAAALVLKVLMHCDACASDIVQHLRAFQGVEAVKAETDSGKVTVAGNVDPTKVRDYLEKKSGKKVQILSPQPEKEKQNEAKPNNKSDKKSKEVVTTAVLKVALHCQGCQDKIRKVMKKTKGVQKMVMDEEKDTVTVEGTMDVKALTGKLMNKLKREVVVVPPKKDNEKEVTGKKKNKGGDGGGNNKNENIDDGGQKIDHNRMEYLVPPFAYSYGYGYGYGHGFGHGNAVGGCRYVPVYPEQMHFHYAPPPQMFSDENPNACSIS
ncbi:hypothetical protein Fmac_021994 [Flemingia macrophylla]|uniref:HMA domain-containing protein n=1 Tax=Flemingia macrophylla TaxID=520843 RepID=A0ABD1LYF7_9FABA